MLRDEFRSGTQECVRHGRIRERIYEIAHLAPPLYRRAISLEARVSKAILYARRLAEQVERACRASLSDIQAAILRLLAAHRNPEARSEYPRRRRQTAVLAAACMMVHAARVEFSNLDVLN